jgi:hypothetical protein
MDARATGIQAAENDLKQLMADVTRAMEKAQEAIAKIASTAAADYPKYGIHTFIAVERVLSFLDRPASAASDLLRLQIGWSRKLAAGVQGKPE